ncbi:MAG TPA: hypothetical protein VN832_09770, partial [Stellaceae bacterium]|nr:hypothetical protein [Stellaceae bacterium]
ACARVAPRRSAGKVARPRRLRRLLRALTRRLHLHFLEKSRFQRACSSRPQSLPKIRLLSKTFGSFVGNIKENIDRFLSK